MATTAPITGACARAPLSPKYGLLNRAAIEAEIERLIALLDAADGDCDLEEEHENDRLDFGEREDWRDDGLEPMRSAWGEDQSKGPINEREVTIDLQRRQMTWTIPPYLRQAGVGQGTPSK